MDSYQSNGLQARPESQGVFTMHRGANELPFCWKKKTADLSFCSVGKFINKYPFEILGILKLFFTLKLKKC